MSWKAYGIVPIDFGWEHLPSLSDVAATMARTRVKYEPFGNSDFDAVKKLLADYQHAKELADGIGWEGDIRGGDEVSVFFLPDENEFAYAFVWKQDNNGTTFVVSPRPLPWLRELL